MKTISVISVWHNTVQELLCAFKCLGMTGAIERTKYGWKVNIACASEAQYDAAKYLLSNEFMLQSGID